MEIWESSAREDCNQNNIWDNMKVTMRGIGIKESIISLKKQWESHVRNLRMKNSYRKENT